MTERDREPCPACGCPGERYDGHVCEDYEGTFAGAAVRFAAAVRVLVRQLLGLVRLLFRGVWLALVALALVAYLLVCVVLAFPDGYGDDGMD